jgi:hypothetical protein
MTDAKPETAANNSSVNPSHSEPNQDHHHQQQRQAPPSVVGPVADGVAVFGGRGDRRPRNDPAHALLSLGQDLPIGDTKEISDGDSGDKLEAIQQPSTPDNNASRPAKNNSKGSRSDETDPPDFLEWFKPGEGIGDFDVLCGRGGESNNSVGNKRYRKVIKERKVRFHCSIDRLDSHDVCLFFHNYIVLIHVSLTFCCCCWRWCWPC